MDLQSSGESRNRNTQSVEPPGERIRLRALVLGLILILAVSRWLFEGEMVRYTFATWAAPFYNAIFILFLLTIANLGVESLFGRPFLNRLETLSIYVMVSVSSALLSTDLVGILITLMGFPTRFATPFNGWDKLFHGILPQWLMVTDSAALRGFYEGNSTFYTWSNIQAWLAPSLWWMLFIAAMFVAFLSLAVLLRKQWTDSERLTFPIVQLPMAMTESPRRFFGDRLMWLGFAIAGGITLLNGMHFLHPTIPEIAIRRHDYDLFVAAPWNVLNPVRISFYFFAITLGFLMPLDLSVSCWLFYLLFGLERVFVASLGLDPTTQVPYTDDQAFGAYMAIGAFALWGIRKHFLLAFRRAFLGGREEVDRDEPASYRTAFLSLALSLIVMIFFARAGGMATWVAILFVIILVLLAVVISRIRCELGFPVHDMHEMGPWATISRLAGPANLPRPTLGAFALFYWSSRVFRSHPMPHQLEGMKLAGSQRQAGRDMLKAILAAGLFAIPLCFWLYLDQFYRLGAGTARVGYWGMGYGFETFPRLESWLRAPEPPLAGHWIGMAAGAAISIGLAFTRSRVVGFPLHPLGYAVANSWGMFNLWLPIMIGSLCKATILRAAGLKMYRRATMFFFGLMLGEFVVGCSWTIFGMLLGYRTYDFWP